MNRFEILCLQAPLEPPTPPRLEAVERRARQRSLRRNTTAAMSVLALSASTLWFTRPTGTHHVVATADSVPSTSAPNGVTLARAAGDDASTSAAAGVVFSGDCSALVRVYNASGRAGVAGEATDTATNAIAADPTLSGSMLEPQYTDVVEEAVTWVLSEGAGCADLARLGLPAATRIERAADPTMWAALDFEAGNTPRIAIILGARYQR